MSGQENGCAFFPVRGRRSRVVAGGGGQNPLMQDTDAWLVVRYCTLIGTGTGDGRTGTVQTFSRSYGGQQEGYVGAFRQYLLRRPALIITS